MNKTKTNDTIELLAVDINKLSEMLSCGKATARKIGEESCARIDIGRRVLYSVEKVKEYLYDISI